MTTLTYMPETTQVHDLGRHGLKLITEQRLKQQQSGQPRTVCGQREYSTSQEVNRSDRY